MAKKNPLAEVMQLDSKRKIHSRPENANSSQGGIFELSDYWQAWEIDDIEPSDSIFVAEGTLEECIKELNPLITMQVNSKVLKLNLEPKQWTKRQQAERETIRQQCYLNGRYKGQGWVIESVIDRKSLESIDNGIFEPI
ncbi:MULTISPECIES: hypothetical protein [unclassified Anabaena]|uniref:hypothetical protein n=1 Tax=unclassified Anabaena TaxID=2619674 RepID=UPI001444EEB4|nr:MULTISPECIES: hypothetical protein [unclassified Anabaena]MTJ10762.1 hypothetical protein [Anabaena sp. UHCC 0204]MTJ55987.1 hypothetical protein [Anabaena sp. UHCC 0253]